MQSPCLLVNLLLLPSSHTASAAVSTSVDRKFADVMMIQLYQALLQAYHEPLKTSCFRRAPEMQGPVDFVGIEVPQILNQGSEVLLALSHHAG